MIDLNLIDYIIKIFYYKSPTCKHFYSNLDAESVPCPLIKPLILYVTHSIKILCLSLLPPPHQGCLPPFPKESARGGSRNFFVGGANLKKLEKMTSAAVGRAENC